MCIPTSRSFSVPSICSLPHSEYTFGSVDEAIQALKRGEFIVVMDDEDRENEGDLIIAAEHITTEKVCTNICDLTAYPVLDGIFDSPY